MNDYNNNDNSHDNHDDYHLNRTAAARRRLSTVALVLSIIAALTFQLFFISLPLSAISIILALISRNKGRMAGKTRAALITGVLAAIISSLFTWFAIRTVYNNPELRQQVEQLYNYYTGGGLDSLSESESEEGSEDPEERLRDILSGAYRERQDENSSDSNSEGNDSLASENGGTFI